ncbi:MAG: DUF1848 domain-containing protein [Treponema sp.]|nr:DUF1848 domain-containing protein [Treponema sp.]
MILSASRRTDIPAFYSDWFYRRVEEGFFLVRNPMNTRQVSRVQVSPQNIASSRRSCYACLHGILGADKEP